MPSRKPNIVWIVADDLGCCDLGFLGNSMVITPHIDALAAESLVLTQHYSASPMCAPARAALQTGKYPHRTGVLDVSTVRGLDRIAQQETLLPQILKDHGYVTGLIGKWHNGSGHPDFHPCRRGYDEFVGFRSGGQGYWHWELECSYGEPLKSEGEQYLTDTLTEEAIRYMSKHADQPFFLQLAYNAPHRPMEAYEEDIEYFLNMEGINRGVATLYAMIKRLDIGVGQVLKHLQSLALDGNTIVLLTSDNGPDFVGEGELSLVREVGFNGHKGDVLEGGIRVPGIIRWPEQIAPHTTCHEKIHFVDWFPTFLHVAGVELPEHLDLDGKNIWHTLTEGIPLEDRPLYWQWSRYEPVEQSNAAVRLGNWKLYYPPVQGSVVFHRPDTQYARDEYPKTQRIITDAVQRTLGKPESPKLYNIASDPLESEDLSSEFPVLVKQLETQLNHWYENVSTEWWQKSKFTRINDESSKEQ